MPSEKIIQIRGFIYKLQDDLAAEANSQNVVLTTKDLKPDGKLIKLIQYSEEPIQGKEFLYI